MFHFILLKWINNDFGCYTLQCYLFKMYNMPFLHVFNFSFMKIVGTICNLPLKDVHTKPCGALKRRREMKEETEKNKNVPMTLSSSPHMPVWTCDLLDQFTAKVWAEDETQSRQNHLIFIVRNDYFWFGAWRNLHLAASRRANKWSGNEGTHKK